MRQPLTILLLTTLPVLAREMPYQHTGSLAPINCSLPDQMALRAVVQGRWLYLEAHNTTQDLWHLDWNKSTLSGKNALAGQTLRTLTGDATYPEEFTSRLTWTGLSWPPKERISGGLMKYSEAGSIEARHQRAQYISVDPEPLYPGTTRTRAVAADLMAFAGWITWPINNGDTITLTLALNDPTGKIVTCTLGASLETGGSWPGGKNFQTYFPDIPAPAPATRGTANPVTARVTITTTPPDAEVSIDGNFVGTTPATITLTPGTHQVLLARAGYQPWSRDLLVTDAPASINAILTPQATMSETPARSTSITGRLFDGIKDSPLPGAHIFVLASDRTTIIGHTITSNERGPLLGTFALHDLPANGEVILVGFHAAVKDNMWLSRFTLNGQANDLRIVNTRMATHSVASDVGRGIWSLLSLAGWVTHEVLATHANESAEELADSLLQQLGAN